MRPSKSAVSGGARKLSSFRAFVWIVPDVLAEPTVDSSPVFDLGSRPKGVVEVPAKTSTGKMLRHSSARPHSCEIESSGVDLPWVYGMLVSLTVPHVWFDGKPRGSRPLWAVSSRRQTYVPQEHDWTCVAS